MVNVGFDDTPIEVAFCGSCMTTIAADPPTTDEDRERLMGYGKPVCSACFEEALEP